MRILIYILMPFFIISCAPSAVILSSVTTEERIFKYDSNREQIEKILGTPIDVKVYDTPVKLNEFAFPNLSLSKNCKVERQQIGSPPYSYIPTPDDPRVIGIFCKYEKDGKIIKQGQAGDSNALAFMSFGISEIFTVPAAISEISSDSSVINSFDVWYSPEGELRAYIWMACGLDNN